MDRATITIRKIGADALHPSVQIAERLAMALDIPLDERAPFVRLARSVRGYGLGERIAEGDFWRGLLRDAAWGGAGWRSRNGDLTVQIGSA